MIGGKIIGQGKAGCIMSPPMICEGETERRNIDNNTLSKLTSIIYSRHEEEVHKLIDSLDPSGNYHIPIDHVCVPRAPILKSNLIDDIKNCNIIQTFSSKTTQRGKIVQNPEITDENAKLFRLILMRDGGNDLLDIGKTILNFPELREKLGGTDFIMMFTYTLFEGLARMTHAGFIHSDIFLTNILYNTATNRFSFIDFGFAFTVDNKLPIYSTRKNAIDFRIPFETLICENPKLFEQYKQDNNLPVDALFDIFYFKFNEVIYRKTLDKYSHYKSASDMKSAIIEGLQNKTLNSLDRDGFRNYIYRKYDVYSLGLTLAIFMRIISGNIYHGRNKKQSKRMTVFEFELAKLFEEMIDPNVVRRIDAHTAVEKFRHILENTGILEKYGYYIDDITGVILPDPTRVQITNINTGELIELRGNPNIDVHTLSSIHQNNSIFKIHINKSPTSYFGNIITKMGISLKSSDHIESNDKDIEILQPPKIYDLIQQLYSAMGIQSKSPHNCNMFVGSHEIPESDDILSIDRKLCKKLAHKIDSAKFHGTVTDLENLFGASKKERAKINKSAIVISDEFIEKKINQIGGGGSSGSKLYRRKTHKYRHKFHRKFTQKLQLI